MRGIIKEQFLKYMQDQRDKANAKFKRGRHFARKMEKMAAAQLGISA